uniref:Lipocalin/cytosolic fatty-acid binding domain-containing protein n=1 Tax=Glossina palpalis gambiensis TaxID=67801 RepID=A0A1B0B8H9_9MUSC
MAANNKLLILCAIILYCTEFTYSWLKFNSYTTRKRTDLKRRCPNVRALRNFDLEAMMGFWHVIQYYASTEELPEYACMHSHFTFSSDDHHFTQIKVTQDEGIYNTYVLDTDYRTWGLIMHCAEKKKHPRYLSALLLSREPQLGDNVINFLREKLPRYDIDLSFMFPINQSACDNLKANSDDNNLAYTLNGRNNAENTLKIMLKH